jgi:hypothetical protein
MGNVTPPDERPLSPLETLAAEEPAQLMPQLLALWPQVEAALKAGHTLRLVHQRLNLAGVPISYKLLSSYRGRIERRKNPHGASPKAPLPAKSPDNATKSLNVLANLRAQEQKRVIWQYPSGPPDESKLI